MKHKIYKYTNKINGKSYIGRTMNFKSRHESHRKANDDCNYFNRAIKKYGEEFIMIKIQKNNYMLVYLKPNKMQKQD